MADNGAQNGGIGFGGALLLLFIGLKLGRVIDWSWWWVMSPAWIPIGVALVVLVGVLAASVVGAFIEQRLPADNWERRKR
jgi:predicted tellurium resistance membrane protein TerC